MIIKSEIAGQIWKTVAHVGQELKVDDTIVIIESMKMEIPVLASDDGKVAEIMVDEEEPVSEGQVVVVLDA